MLREPVRLNGAHGEGGGQIIRTALTISVVTGRPFHIENIRAKRRVPGLAAQHLTAVRAAAAICRARVLGDTLGSTELEFAPTTAARCGDYRFDVAAARAGGSAGAATLVLQTVLLPLGLANGNSRLFVSGGTHLPWSPSFDYVRDVWLPAFQDLGIKARLELLAWGWFPLGGGELRADIEGVAALQTRPLPSRISDRGELLRVRGRAVAANLPAHIPERMSERASALLAPLGVELNIIPECVSARCAGAGIFLTAEYAHARAGFSALGKVGKPAEEVAQDAADALWRHHGSAAALESHLADQILLPLAFASGRSLFTASALSRHVETNSWVIEQFGIARITIARGDAASHITVEPTVSLARPGE
jgi:RNA 3'-terminal phosphate cyclase (ATP)